MAELDYTKIDQPYNEYASRHVLPVLPGNPSDFDPNSGEDVVKTGQSLENLTISTWIKSRNFMPNKQGFMLDGAKGNFYGNNVFLTGTINALLGKLGSANNYWSIGSNGITAVANTGDVIINYGKTDFGQDAILGFIIGYDYSASAPKIEMGSSATKYFKYDGTNVTIVGGIITSGTIRTSSGNPRVEMNGTNNRIDVYNSAGTNIAWFGGIGTQGNVLYINQTNTSDDFPPVYITCANTSNVLNLFNTNSSIVNRPGFRFESNNAASETAFFYNTGAYISTYFQSNGTTYSTPTTYSKNTANGWCWGGEGHMLLNGDWNFYLRYTNTYLHVNTNGELKWANSLGDNFVVFSDDTTGAPAAASGSIRVQINGILYDLLYK